MVKEARQKLLDAEAEEAKTELQLPTPPDDNDNSHLNNRMPGLYGHSDESPRLRLDTSPSMSPGDENAIETESDLENDPRSFEGPQLDDIRFPGDPLDATFPPDPLSRATRSYSFPNPESMTGSPASSNAADAGGDTPDMDFTDLDDDSTTQDESKLDTAGADIPARDSALQNTDP